MLRDYCIKFNGFFEKFMPFVTITGIVAGFLLKNHITGFAPAVTWLFAFITFTGALTMNLGDFIKVMKNPLPIFIFLIAFHILLPFITWIVATVVFNGNTAFITGFVLLFAIPTAVVGFMWTGIYGGNGPLTLSIILIDTILAPFLVPITVGVFMKTQVHIDGFGMFLSLVWMVVLPSIFGVLLNQLSRGSFPKAVVPYFKPLSKLGLLCVIAINASRAAHSVTAFEPIFIQLIIVCIVLSFGGFAVGKFLTKLFKLSDKDSVSVMFTVGLRNISAALVLALNFFEPRAALPVIISIMFQQTLAAIAGIVLMPKKKTGDVISAR